MKKLLFYIFILTISLLAISGSIGTLYFYFRFSEAQKQLKQINVETEEDVRNLVGRVGRLMQLPSDELPTVMTVTDSDRLKNLNFFTNALVGHKLLIYEKAHKAILFDPIQNVIIEVAPSNMPTVTPETATAAPPAADSQIY